MDTCLPEIKRLICCEISIQTLNTLSRVNREWNTICSSDQVWERQTQILYPNIKISSKLTSTWLEKFKKNVYNQVDYNLSGEL